MPSPAIQPPHRRSSDPSRAGGGDAVLWASACVLAAFVVIQAGRPVSDAASADASAAAALAAQSGAVDGFSIVAGRSGRGDDADPTKIVWVIDSTAGAVMVYEVEDARRNAITFREGSSLPLLFESARR
ncbi:MAG: hypothetical protein ACYTEV_07315 [Planctomycetota bacterium]|jgi:hypothetical protein